MKRLTLNISGFTLIEVTVGIAVFALVMIAASGIFMSVQDGWQKQKRGLDAVGNARWAVEFMVNEIRQERDNSAMIYANGDRFSIATPGGDSVWYWRGNTLSDTTGLGDRRRLYRGPGPNLPNAYSKRIELANFVSDNPSGNGIFSLVNGTVRIELATNTTGKPYTVRSAVIPRNP